MHPADIPKTAIITPFGLFKFLRLPFSLRNAAQTFQRMMDRIFGDLPFCFVYLDDNLVFSNSLSDHLLHLRHVLDLCCLNSLTINLLLKFSILVIQSPALFFLVVFKLFTNL